MSEINRTDPARTTPAVGSPGSVNPVQPLDIALRSRVAARANTLAMTSMLSNARRPPLFRARGGGAKPSSAYEKLLDGWSGPLSALSTTELSYLVSCTFERQVSLGSADSHPSIIAGLQTLDKIARMYEHLAILQSGPTDVG